MDIQQAKQRLMKLGFVFDAPGVPKWGRRDLTEAFDFSPNHLLSVPYRDIYIGKSKDGWYIGSSIHFYGRLYRHRAWNARWMDRRSVFGLGNNLQDAVRNFEADFHANESANAPKA
jgi:hypothetical protein